MNQPDLFSTIVHPLFDFSLPPRCSQVVRCHWGEIEPCSTTLTQDGLAECDQPGNNPLKNSAMAGNWNRETWSTMNKTEVTIYKPRYSQSMMHCLSGRQTPLAFPGLEISPLVNLLHKPPVNLLRLMEKSPSDARGLLVVLSPFSPPTCEPAPVPTADWKQRKIVKRISR